MVVTTNFNTFANNYHRTHKPTYLPQDVLSTILNQRSKLMLDYKYKQQHKISFEPVKIEINFFWDATCVDIKDKIMAGEDPLKRAFDDYIDGPHTDIWHITNEDPNNPHTAEDLIRIKEEVKEYREYHKNWLLDMYEKGCHYPHYDYLYITNSNDDV